MSYKREDVIKAVNKLEKGREVKLGYGDTESYIEKEGENEYYSSYTDMVWEDAELALVDALEMMTKDANEEGKKVWLK